MCPKTRKKCLYRLTIATVIRWNHQLNKAVSTQVRSQTCKRHLFFVWFFYSVLRRWVKNDEAVVNGTQGGTCLAFSLSMPPCNPNKYSQTHRGTELARLMRRNKTVPSAENRTKEGKKPAVLIGIPSSWSSWIQTLSHSQLTQRNRKKTREEGGCKSNREHIFDCCQNADPTSPLHPTAVYVAARWFAKTFLWRPNAEAELAKQKT